MRFAKRTAKKLIQDEALLPNLGGVRLRMTLDKYLWKERDHVTLKELAEWFPRYLYLPRIRDREVLVAAIQDGGKTLTVGDTFATAEAYDEASKRYLGLRIGGGAPSVIGSATCVVKPDVARKQRDAEAVSVAPTAGGGPVPSGRTGAGTKPLTTPSSNEPSQPPVPSKPKTFVGSLQLNGVRVGRDAGRFADEVLSHLAALPGAQVNVTLDVVVTVPGGVDSSIVRIVTENANALKFSHASFEME